MVYTVLRLPLRVKSFLLRVREHRVAADRVGRVGGFRNELQVTLHAAYIRNEQNVTDLHQALHTCLYLLSATPMTHSSCCHLFIFFLLCPCGVAQGLYTTRDALSLCSLCLVCFTVFVLVVLVVLCRLAPIPLEQTLTLCRRRRRRRLRPVVD